MACESMISTQIVFLLKYLSYYLISVFKQNIYVLRFFSLELLANTIKNIHSERCKFYKKIYTYDRDQERKTYKYGFNQTISKKQMLLYRIIPL